MTMKNYTDIEQSMRLAEFLSLESADMWYSYYGNSKHNPTIAYNGEQWFLCQIRNSTHSDIPCWSLAALLDIIRNAIGYTLQTTYNKNPKVFIVCELGDKPYSIESTEYDNEVDACYDMILNLHELNLL